MNADAMTGVASRDGELLARWLTTRREQVVHAWFAAQFDPATIKRYKIVGAGEEHRAGLLEHFVGPLFDLLVEVLRCDSPDLLAVYLDERLRYAPHRAGLAERAAFFGEVLARDLGALLIAGEAPGGRDALVDRWHAIHAPLLDSGTREPVLLLALGDCLMNELRVFLPPACRGKGISLDMRGLYFSAIGQSGLEAGEVLDCIAESPPHLIAASFMSYEGVPVWSSLLREADVLTAAQLERRIEQLLALIRGFVAQLRAKTDATLLIHNASGLPLSRWRKRIPGLAPISPGRARLLDSVNYAVGELVENTSNAILIDERAIAEKIGLRAATRAVVPRRIARGALFHTARFGAALAEPYLDVVSSFSLLRKAKVLAVDFDNTLWRGVMADGEVEHYASRQRLLRSLREGGILLVSVSKNDYANVRWNEMRLEPADFVLHRISWNPKTESIRDAAQQLDLGLDSFVLIDDSPIERELVSMQLPEVRVLDSTDPQTWAALERLLRFPNTRETDEAKRRTETYREQAARRDTLEGHVDYAAMMRSLGLVARFGKAARKDLERVEELIQRTNQFNATTIRYGRAQLEPMLTDPGWAVYAADLSDRFGKLGLVGVAIVRRQADGSRAFDSFVMSCRAMGLQFERLLLRCAIDAEGPGRVFKGRFVQTDRNAPASRLYADAGFERVSETDWQLAPDAPLPPIPAWFETQPRGAETLTGASDQRQREHPLQ